LASWGRSSSNANDTLSKMYEETITSEFTFKTKKKYLISLQKQISYLLGLRKKNDNSPYGCVDLAPSLFI